MEKEIKKRKNNTFVKLKKEKIEYVGWDQKDPKSSTVKPIVENWVKENYKDKKISKSDVENFVFKACLENILWVTNDLVKESSILANKILEKKKQNQYFISWVCKEIYTHYSKIYKKKSV